MRIRLAETSDIPALASVIEASARGLSDGFYTPRQVESAIRYVFGVDSQLIADGTYFAAMNGEEIAGCGGWSKRATLYGGDQAGTRSARLLDPSHEAARIRAFFVAPSHARAGVGTLLLEASEDAARTAGFRRMELMATLPGVPFYAARGYAASPPTRDTLPDGTTIAFVRMERLL
ncbi:MAG TPA: GNAT family N-acetyltransferase [Candidatus Polarisedimenticolaceae bacterium]|nr:GNAT family N-acetyltransferase [Candidatus Polarisedimenticolaceae bacterium]